MDKFHLHLISDSTGETLGMISRAVWTRFELTEPIEHIYALVRTKEQIEDALERIRRHKKEGFPVLVMCTLVDDDLKQYLERQCYAIDVPCIAVLDDIVERLNPYLDKRVAKKSPGGQHAMDNVYYNRVAALSWTLAHDDGQQLDTLDQGDVILLGLSRTSKTPTCFYLAHRGIKAANIPLVPEVPLRVEWAKLTKPLVVGLTLKPTRLLQVRQQRFEEGAGNYINSTAIAKEFEYAQSLFKQLNCPVIDVTQRSVEESAAAILNLKRERDEKEL